MKFISKLKGAAASAALLTAAQGALADSFSNVQSNGFTLGKLSKNVATSFIDSVSGLEAALYFFAIVFFILFIFTLVKWKKSNGNQGEPGLIMVYFLVSICCMAAPTLMGGGMSTIFGSGAVQTVKAPTPSFDN